MPRLVKRLPSFRLHKPSGQAVVTLDGKDVYLGPYALKSSRAEYNRVVAEWLANDRRRPAVSNHDDQTTVGELILRYWKFAQNHYTRDGAPSRELDNIRDALRPIRELYGHTPAVQFGPLAIKTVRQSMIAAGLARTTINYRIAKARKLWKWAVENELIPPSVYHALLAVRGLLRGRDGVRDTEPIKPVPDADVEAVLPHVTKPVAAMIQVQLLTGMRPGEVAAMRGMDVDRSEAVWIYRPPAYKTVRYGHERTIAIGPQAQAVLEPWLVGAPGDFVFSPAAAEASRHAERRRARKTPMTPSQAKRKPKRNPKRSPRSHYTRGSYGTAILRACKKAGVEPWAPNRLRHNAATKLRRTFGIEAARAILGHRSATVTEVYAEHDQLLVVRIMAAVG